MFQSALYLLLLDSFLSKQNLLWIRFSRDPAPDKLLISYYFNEQAPYSILEASPFNSNSFSGFPEFHVSWFRPKFGNSMELACGNQIMKHWWRLKIEMLKLYNIYETLRYKCRSRIKWINKVIMIYIHFMFSFWLGLLKVLIELQ